MPISDIWTLIGLSLGTIGAVLLAYDVVYGAGTRFQASVLKMHLESLRNMRKHSRDVTTNLPQPPWTPAEIKEQLEQEEKKWGPKEKTLVQKVDTFYKEYEGQVVTLGAYGVLMIVAGFLLQIVGLILHAAEMNK